MDNNNQQVNERLDKAKLDFNKYCNDKELMTFEEFKIFLNYFLSDQPEEVKIKFPVKQFFEEYALSNKVKIERREFEQAWDELNMRRLETKDSI